MKKHKKEFLRQLILEHADFDGYDIPQPETVNGYINTLSDIFHSEKSWEIKKYGIYKASTSWFQGLPSACSVPFWNDEIESLGLNPETYWDELGEVFADMILKGE